MEWYNARFAEMDEYFAVSDAGVETMGSDIVGDDAFYNLQGIRISPDKLQPGQIYIRNGKKIIVR